VCGLSAGFYFGSHENSYVRKFLFGATSRFPANEAVQSVQDLWTKGQFRTVRDEVRTGKVYSPLLDSEQNICDVYPDARSIKVHLLAESSVSDSKVRLSAEIDCDNTGPSFIFVKSFCSERLFYFKEVQTVSNTKFNFENILDGFPRSWYVESADVSLRDGMMAVGIKPPRDDVAVFGKYTVDCSEF